MSRAYTDGRDLVEIEELKKSYDVEKTQAGVYLVEDWLFIYPKNQKWGHRYDNAFGFYERGKLKEFVDKATDEYKFPETYYGKVKVTA